jgi:hypothetical protein
VPLEIEASHNPDQGVLWIGWDSGQELRRAIATIDHVIEDYVAGARLKRAA